MEKVCRTVALHYAVLNSRSPPISELVCLLAVLKVCDSDTYRALANNTKVSLDPLLSKLDAENMELLYARIWLLACTGNEDQIDEAHKPIVSDNYGLWQHRDRIIGNYCAKMDYFH